MYDALVLGAGVYGLSIATELTNRGFKVAIVARDLPEDEFSTGFASPWAGCNWCSFEEKGDTRAAEWDAITFKALAKLAVDRPDLCKRIPFQDMWTEERGLPWYHDLVFGAKLLRPEDGPMPGGFPFGVAYESYIINAPAYIKYLAANLRARGVPFIRRRLTSLDEAYDISETGSVDLVVNALALGNKTLVGVQDEKMYPAQGQTVLVKAPLVNQCTMATGTAVQKGPKSKPVNPVDEEVTYIIPRPGPDGHVVLGGTFNKDNYSVLPNLNEAERILKSCYALNPLLAGPDGKSWKDIEVVAHNVGLRPSREGGVRLELESREIGADTKLAPKVRGRKRAVKVVHAYGPGGTGYQSSIGLSEKVADIVMSELGSKAKL